MTKTTSNLNRRIVTWVKQERRGVQLTKEIDDESAVRESTSGSPEKWATVRETNGVTESGGESTRVRVGISEVKDHGRILASSCHRQVLSENEDHQQETKEEEGMGVERERSHLKKWLIDSVHWELCS